MSSPCDVADAIGWGPVVSIATTIALALLGYGASNQRSKQTDATVDRLEKEHGAAMP